jgi:hypothetical protein
MRPFAASNTLLATIAVLFAALPSCKELKLELDPKAVHALVDSLGQASAALDKIETSVDAMVSDLTLPVHAEELARYTAVASPLAAGRYQGDPGRDFFKATAVDGDQNVPASVMPLVVTLLTDDRISICSKDSPPQDCEAVKVTWFKDDKGRIRPVFADDSQAMRIARFEIVEFSPGGFTVLLLDEMLEAWKREGGADAELELTAVPLRFLATSL